MVLDTRGRPLHELRVSLTDNCNFRCVYCMPAESFPSDYPFLKADQLLAFDQIVAVVEAAVLLGLRKVKLTGGEPTLRSGLPELVARLRRAAPHLELGLITNGLHLRPLLPRLRAAGLDTVTVSLDSLDPVDFGGLTGTGQRLQTVLDAIEAARDTFGRVKVNTVLLRGRNEGQVEPLARRYRRPGFALRFIEFMDVGTLNRWTRDQVVSGGEVKARLDRLEEGLSLAAVPPRHLGETSERWAWSDGQGEVGFINAVSRPFCSACSRARLGADGRLYTCLFAARGADLRPALAKAAGPSDLADELARVWSRRDDRYSELRTAVPGPRVEMFAVGG